MTDPLTRALTALFLLMVGYIVVRLIKASTRHIVVRRPDLNRKERDRRLELVRESSFLMYGIVILASLLYLEAGITSGVTERAAEAVPSIISALLFFLLGAIIIEALSQPFSRAMEEIGIKSYFRRSEVSKTGLKVASLLGKAFLYLIVIQVALTQAGIGELFIEDAITAFSWAVMLLLAGLIFYGARDLFRNYAAGLYLKSSSKVRPGEQVEIDGEMGDIKEISAFSTTIDTMDGYVKRVQNSEVMDSDFRVKKTQSDIETLEDITSHFVAQKSAYCGPASAEMALEIFGYRHTQEEIGEASDVDDETGTEVEDLVEAVEELTGGEVKASFVGFDKIADLQDELKAWLAQDGLVIANFYKPAIFPESTTGHYVLVVGVEGEEALIMDPSSKKGGVYFVDIDDLYEAMGDHGHKRGYIPMAPEGTTAHWRLKNDLIYAQKSYYDEISKTLETRLKKLMRQGRILKDVTPEQVNRFMGSWGEKAKIDRLWKPNEEEQS